MTIDGFRKLALGLPEAEERAHMGHPDFRIGGKIFATLGYPDRGWGMVKLTPEQQDGFVDADGAAFAPVKGGWGKKGATNVNLKAVRRDLLKAALVAAWLNTAPKKLAATLDRNE
jgi:hypothetical protein